MASTQLILLTGATGYIGGRLLKESSRAGGAFDASPGSREFLRPRVAETARRLFSGDVLEPPAWPRP